MKIRPLLLGLIVFLLVILPVYATLHGVAGYVILNDTVNPAVNATVRVRITFNETFMGTDYPCNCSVDPYTYNVRTAIDGTYSTDLNNLHYDETCFGGNHQAGDPCGDDWSVGDPIWAEADGSTVSPPQGNGTSNVTNINAFGSQWLPNITLAVGPNTPPNISGIPDNYTLEDTVPDWEIDLWNYTTDAQDNVSEMNYSIIAQTNSTLINCSLRANRYLNCSKPEANLTGSSNVTVQVEDTGGLKDDDTMTVTVIPVNDPPVLEIVDQSTLEDTMPSDEWIDLWDYVYDIDNLDSELNFSIVSQSNTSLIDCVLKNNRYINCSKPAANQTGYSLIYVNVTDPGNLSDVDDFYVNVIPVNDPPYWVVIPPDQQITEDSGVNYVLNLTGYGADIDNATEELTYVVSDENTSEVDCGMVSGTNLTLTPAANWTGIGVDAAQCGLKVYDGELYSVEVIININVTQVNDPPVIKDCYNPSVDEDTDPPDNWVNLSDCTTDIDNTTEQLAWAVEAQTNASLINCSISDSYHINCSMPAANQSGVNNLTVNVTDGEYWDSIIITVTVNPINDAPYWLLVVPNQTIEEDSGLNNLLNLSGYGADVDNTTDELSFVISGENINEVDCEIVGRTNLTATPAANWTGVGANAASCGIKVFDGQYNSSEFIVYINVTNVNDAPFFEPALEDQIVDEDQTLIYDINATDIDPTNDILSYYDNVTEFEINRSTGLINWTPGNDDIGVLWVEITVCDDSGAANNCTSGIFKITVNPINDPPVFNVSRPVQNVTWPEDATDSSINLTPSFYDIDSPDLNYSYTPADNITVMIDNGTGIVTLIPDANFTGIRYVRFRATDGQLWSNYSNNVTLNVTPVNDPPFLTDISLNQTTGKVGTPIKVTSNGAGDIDSANYYMMCGNESGNYNLCSGSLGSGERSCDFITPWTDNNAHTVYCVLNDTINISGEVTTTFIADNIPPNASIINNLEGDTVPKYWDTDNDNNLTCQLNLDESNMRCRWDYVDLPYSQMNASRECTVAGQIASCNFISNITEQINETTMYVSCQDQYGNDQNSTQNKDVTFGVDWTIPDVVHTNDGKIHLPGYTVTLTIKDMPPGTVVTVHYCNDTTGTCIPYIRWTGTNGSQKIITFNERGIWWLRWNATDEAGNVNLTNQTKQTIVFINTLPQISDQVYYNTTKHLFIVNASVYDAVGSSQGVNYSCWLYYRKGAAAYSNKSMQLISGSATNGVYSANVSADGYDVFDVIDTYVNCSDGMEWNISSVDSNAIPNFKPSAPTIAIVPTSPAIDDDLYCNITVNSTDPDNDAISYYYEWYKNGAKQNNINIPVVGSGNTTKGEEWNCTVIPYDGYENGTAGSDKVVIANSAPVFNTSRPIQNVTWPEDSTDSSINLTYHFYDLDGDSLIYYYTSVEDITVYINQTTGIVTLIPDANFTGVMHIRFNATDGQLWSDYSNNVTLNVTNVNDAPFFEPALENQIVNEGQTLIYDINATDIDPSYVLSFYDNVSEFDIDTSTGLINWTPGNDDVGVLWVEITVCDDSGAANNCTSGIFKITVNPINDPPVFNTSAPIQNVTWPEDSVDSSINLTPSFYDIDSPDLNYSYTPVQNITVMIDNGTGIVTLIPDANFTGIRYVRFKATDGQLWSNYSNNVTLNVTNVNDPPYFDPALPDNLTAYENITFVYDINVTDIDPTNDVLTFTSNSTLFTINSTTGLINFTPNSSQIGTYSINFSVCDNYNACDSKIVEFIVLNVINDITFYVRDRIFQTPLNNVAITGGTSCPAGCLFNYTTTIVEPTNVATFTFSKPGFADNVTTLNITSDMEVNITMDDNESPQIVLVDITPRLNASNDSFWIDVILDVTDNFKLANATFTYTLSKGFSESGTIDMARVDNDTFNGSIGPYSAEKFFMESSVFVNDSYGNSVSQVNDDIWFMFVVGGNVTFVYARSVDIELKKGWNLFSIPSSVSNTSIRSILNQLGNGKWGCGRDNSTPIRCNESAGDFVGNWTSIWSYNKTDGTWLVFDPTDYYLTIPEGQEFQTLEFYKGYWINMTAGQNLTINYRG